MGPPNMKKMLTVKLKPRMDPYCDQFSRIIMLKVLMVTATVTGITWMKDKVNCIVPKNHDTSKAFVAKACWINGMYIFDDLPARASSYYYGIPADITSDGLTETGSTCSTRGPGNSLNSFCTGLEKTFFLQYQWFPMGVVFLTFLYYLPYLFFKYVNQDMEALKPIVKGKVKLDHDVIIDKFFKTKRSNKAVWRILCNIIIKALYVGANMVGLLVVDSALSGRFIDYGSRWLDWVSLETRRDYTVKGQLKAAGPTLLPNFALCQVRSEAQDIKTQYSNVQTYICELSQHVLYQYILIFLWFMQVIGIVVSLLGLVKHMIDIIWKDCIPTTKSADVSRLYSKLSIRERQLMDYICTKNLPLFGELMKRMNEGSKKDHDVFDDEPEKRPMLS